MVKPVLLLAPDGSFDRNGAVSPTVGSSVTVISGQYGNAWHLVGGADGVVTSPVIQFLGPTTILVRVRRGSTNQRTIAHWINSLTYAFMYATTATLRLMHNAGSALNVTGVPAHALGTWGYAAGAWDGTNGKIVTATQSASAAQSAAHPTTSTSVVIGKDGDVEVEGLLIYDRVLTDADIRRIGGLAASWTWDMLDDGPIPGLLLPV